MRTSLVREALGNTQLQLCVRPGRPPGLIKATASGRPGWTGGTGSKELRAAQCCRDVVVSLMRYRSAKSMGGGLPSTARLGYPISACTATSEKFSRQVAVKFALDS